MIEPTKQYDFWNGPDLIDRRVKYAKEFKPEYQTNGNDVQRRIAPVVVAFGAEMQIVLPEGWASGWRPASVNEATSNAGKLSQHLIANAGDKRDDMNGAFAWWCMAHVGVLEQHGLYMEHPVATVVRAWKRAKDAGRTPTPWCHLTPQAPGSHNRVYWPDSASPSEWQAFVEAGGKAGMTYEGWLALDGHGTEVAEFATRDAQ